MKNFSSIPRPLIKLLEKNVTSEFNEDLMNVFLTLKKKLVEAPVMVSRDRNLPFELMYDASDFAVGVVLG